VLNQSSLPGRDPAALARREPVTRQSILFRKKIDARVKPAHDASASTLR
jgi:hypothetical protein